MVLDLYFQLFVFLQLRKEIDLCGFLFYKYKNVIFIQLGSTTSSALNSCSAIIWKDVVCLIWPGLPEKWNVAATKLLGKMMSFIKH